MRRIITTLVISFLGSVYLFLPHALTASSSIVISEIQTGSQTDAGQEFVELYNPTALPVPLAGWIMQYKSATGTTWTKKATLTGQIASDGFYLLSSTGYLAAADATFAAGLSGTAGHVRLVDPTGLVIDTVGWGLTANAPETAPAPAPGPGQSIERAPGWLIEDGGNGSDTDDNSVDFLLRDIPLPQSTASAPEVPQPRPDDLPASDDTAADVPATPIVYPALQLSELVPDPAEPQTDADDEFIELYNPNDQPVNVQGYVLKTGSNFHAAYILTQRVMEPGDYLAVYSAVSHLQMPNGGSAVELFDPGGTLLDQTDNYGVAKTGQAFAFSGGEWEWTLEPTPGDANVIVAEEAAAVEAVSPTPKPAKVKAVKAAKAPKAKKAKAPKAVKAKTAKKSTTTTTETAADVLPAASQPASGRWLLLCLASLTLCYIGFEFRYDLRNLYHRFRRHE